MAEHTTSDPLVKRFTGHGAIRVARGDHAAIHEYLRDNFVNHPPPIHDQDAQGVQFMKDNMTEAGKAILDFRSTIDLIIDEGDLVCVHWMARGAHTGTMQHWHVGAVEATGREIKISGLTVYRIADGKLAELWNYNSHMDFLVHIGELTATA